MRIRVIGFRSDPLIVDGDGFFPGLVGLGSDVIIARRSTVFLPQAPDFFTDLFGALQSMRPIKTFCQMLQLCLQAAGEALLHRGFFLLLALRVAVKLHLSIFTLYPHRTDGIVLPFLDRHTARFIKFQQALATDDNVLVAMLLEPLDVFFRCDSRILDNGRGRS